MAPPGPRPLALRFRGGWAGGGGVLPATTSGNVTVKGVMTLRGRVVLVVDLGRLLSMTGQVAAGGKVVLLELARAELGRLVTGVEGLENIEGGGPHDGSAGGVRGPPP